MYVQSQEESQGKTLRGEDSKRRRQLFWDFKDADLSHLGECGECVLSEGNIMYEARKVPGSSLVWLGHRVLGVERHRDGEWENELWALKNTEAGEHLRPLKNSVLSDSWNLFLLLGTQLRKRFLKRLLCLSLFTCFLQNPVFNPIPLAPLSCVFPLLYSRELLCRTPEAGHVRVFRVVGLPSRDSIFYILSFSRQHSTLHKDVTNAFYVT